jgi:hypothetical protein
VDLKEEQCHAITGGLLLHAFELGYTHEREFGTENGSSRLARDGTTILRSGLDLRLFVLFAGPDSLATRGFVNFFLYIVTVLGPMAMGVMGVWVGMKLAKDSKDRTHKSWWVGIIALRKLGLVRNFKSLLQGHNPKT